MKKIAEAKATLGSNHGYRSYWPEPLQPLINYVEVTKPRSVFLLVFTSLVTIVLASRLTDLPFPPISLALLAVILACSGANTVSCYIDRDLDASMERTKHRPLPSGRISPPIKALYWGFVQLAAALAISWLINPFSFICLFLGIIGYVYVYSLWLKRKSTLNIVLGGISGGLPVLFGWANVTGTTSVLALLISLVVILWIPNHIWNLAIYYQEDYQRVGVPVLPVVANLKKVLRCILVTVALMFATSILIYKTGEMGYFYLISALILGTILLAFNIYLYLFPSRKNAWLVFKLSSPYLFLLFLAMLIDIWL